MPGEAVTFRPARLPTSTSRFALAGPFVLSILCAFAVQDGDRVVPLSAQGGKSVPRLGPHTVGTGLRAVRRYRADGECNVEGSQAECTFVEPVTGVRYGVSGDAVMVTSARRGQAKVRLPFGLQFGDPLAEVLRKAVATRGARWVVVSHSPGAVEFSSVEEFTGEGGWTFRVDLVVAADGLAEVRYAANNV